MHKMHFFPVALKLCSHCVAKKIMLILHKIIQSGKISCPGSLVTKMSKTIPFFFLQVCLYNYCVTKIDYTHQLLRYSDFCRFFLHLATFVWFMYKLLSIHCVLKNILVFLHYLVFPEFVVQFKISLFVFITIENCRAISSIWRELI